jgi:hypothetical protein
MSSAHESTIVACRSRFPCDLTLIAEVVARFTTQVPRAHAPATALTGRLHEAEQDRKTTGDATTEGWLYLYISEEA